METLAAWLVRGGATLLWGVLAWWIAEYHGFLPAAGSAAAECLWRACGLGDNAGMPAALWTGLALAFAGVCLRLVADRR